MVPSQVVQYFEGKLDPAAAEAGELVQAVDRIIRHADARRRLGVRANADTGEDCARARRFGAAGHRADAGPSTCSWASDGSSSSG